MNKATESSPTLLRFAILPLIFILASLKAYGDPAVLTPGEVGAAYSFQITIDPAPPEGTQFTATSLPPGLVIGLNTGLISGNPTTVGVYDQGKITLQYPDQTSDTLKISISVTAAAGTPKITSANTASGTVGQAFSYTITADNTPQSFNVSGDLPDGVTFSGSIISGTPAESGTFSVTLSGNNSSGTGDELSLTITIDPAGAVPGITSAASLSGDLNTLLTYQIEATESPTSYSASPLPPGVGINAEGFINGTPTNKGVWYTEVTATNANGTSDVFKLTIIIGDLPQISSLLSISETEFNPIDYQLSASFSTESISFTVDADSLPTGLTFNPSTNKIAGIPTEVGTFNVEVFASNNDGDGPISTLEITITAKPAFVQLRPATFSVVRSASVFELYLEFDQSVDDLAAYNWIIETSDDLEEWAPLDLDDQSLTVEITDNPDNTKSVKVLYPNFQPTDTMIFIRYRVEAKQP